MNIIIITSGKRPELLRQTLESIQHNCANINNHTITLVVDGPRWQFLEGIPTIGMTVIVNPESCGASRSRNIGAGSIPKYRRQDHVMFLDDDVYMCNKWDEKLLELATAKDLDFSDTEFPANYKPNSIISGYSHPFNQCSDGRMVTEYGWRLYGIPLVISSVAMMMPWTVFDDVGPWNEPGGPGCSEDYAISMRAKEKGYGFAVTSPHCAIHTGLISSKGEPIVGYKELCEQNDKLLDFHNIRGRVIFQ